MKNKLILTGILALVALCGCARFSTNQLQHDIIDTLNPEGFVVSRTTRDTSTKAASTTFFEAKSSLANFKASQTDKSQSATVGGINQEASSTNLTAIIGVVVGAAVSAAAKSAVPIP